MKKTGKDFYSVRCIFKHRNTDNSNFIYEERVTLWKASSFEEAITLAEIDAKNYASEINCTYTGLSQSFHLLKNEIKK